MVGCEVNLIYTCGWAFASKKFQVDYHFISDFVLIAIISGEFLKVRDAVFLIGPLATLDVEKTLRDWRY